MGSQNLWTFLLEYSVVQGALLSILVAVRTRQFYLSILLLAVSYLLFSYLFERFEWYVAYPAFLWTNVPFWFAIGPLFYLHGVSIFRKDQPFKTQDLLHFIPSLMVVVFFFQFYFIYNPAEKIHDYETMFGADYNFDFVQIAYVLQIVVYGYLSLTVTRKRLAGLKEQESDSSYIHLSFLKNSYTGFIAYALAAMTMALILVSFQDMYEKLLRYYSLVFLALASVVHISTYYFLIYKSSIPSKPSDFLKNTKKGTGKYASSSLGDKELKSLLNQIREYIHHNESYKNPNLRISDLAESLNIPSHHISQCLNQLLGKNFFDFINEYRVEAVKQNLLNPDFGNYTLFAIASECGFNSHSSFYRIFKKNTGQTPKAFIEANQ